MTPFMLEIVLRSAIILSRRRTLDGLLVGIAGERFGSQAAIDLPLLRQDSIVHASQMLVGIPDGSPVRPTTFIQSFVRTLTTEPDITEMLSRPPSASSMSYGSGPNSNIESVYLTLNVPAVYFLGVGDIAGIRSLLTTLVHIGSQAHRGMGEVEHTNLIEVEADPTWFGVVGHWQEQRIVLRPEYHYSSPICCRLIPIATTMMRPGSIPISLAIQGRWLNRVLCHPSIRLTISIARISVACIAIRVASTRSLSTASVTCRVANIGFENTTSFQPI